MEKLKSMDDGFRKQMDSKETNHREELEQIMQQKQEEIDVANQKVPPPPQKKKEPNTV